VGRIKRIHVNQHIIKSNRKNDESAPVVTVQLSDRSIRGHRIIIHGKSSVVYRPHKPLKCGATVWVETRGLISIERDTSRGVKTEDIS